MGLKAKKFIEQGALVSDDVVIGIIKERLKKSDCEKGFILDGFPRTVPQAEALDAMGVTLDVVLSLEVKDEAIVQRMSGRRVCSGCGTTYHTLYNPSAKGEECDRCGAKLTIRADDAPDVVASRLEVYHSVTEPLKDFYSEKGILKIVEGAEALEETTARTLNTLGI